MQGKVSWSTAIDLNKASVSIRVDVGHQGKPHRFKINGITVNLNTTAPFVVSRRRSHNHDKDFQQLVLKFIYYVSGQEVITLYDQFRDNKRLNTKRVEFHDQNGELLQTSIIYNQFKFDNAIQVR